MSFTSFTDRKDTMDIEKAWKDPDYRAALTEAELAQLPDNPAGLTALNSAQLSTVHGGQGTTALTCLPLTRACTGTFITVGTEACTGTA